MQRTAFTLIELLIVIAIIAILAALLFPVFSRAQAKAQQGACLNNLKELQLGVTLYEGDFDGRYLPYGTGQDIWQGLLLPYVKNAQLYLCPNDPNQSSVWHGPHAAISACSYGYNNQHRACSDLDGAVVDTCITYPAEMFCLADATSWTLADETAFTSRHSAGTDLSFFDGHTKFVSLLTLQTAYTSAGATVPASADRHFWWGVD
jgi:prepilin-type N-terminal cleavage/methylation domain-containing protein